MSHASISHEDILRLDHIRNVGQLISDLTRIQDCHEAPPADQRAQLASLIYLMTAQLDGVVARCSDGWMNMEVQS